jgi:hypothetical protein
MNENCVAPILEIESFGSIYKGQEPVPRKGMGVMVEDGYSLG